MTAPTAALRAALTDQATDVRGLSVRQPWASAIAHLGKRVENRGRPVTYTGHVLIHASRTPDAPAMREAPTDLPHRDARGAILAVARIADCHSATTCAGRCDPWAEPPIDWAEPRPIWHWRLADVVPLAYPVSARGAVYLWRPAMGLRHQVAASLPTEGGV